MHDGPGPLAEVLLSIGVATPFVLGVAIVCVELSDWRQRRAQKRERAETPQRYVPDPNPKTKPIIVSDNWKWKD